MFGTREEVREHLKDCKEYREQNKIEMQETKAEIQTLTKSVKKLQKLGDRLLTNQAMQHRQNAASLTWQRNLLIGVIISIIGWLGVQVWDKVDPQNLEILQQHTKTLMDIEHELQQRGEIGHGK